MNNAKLEMVRLRLRDIIAQMKEIKIILLVILFIGLAGLFPGWSRADFSEAEYLSQAKIFYEKESYADALKLLEAAAEIYPESKEMFFNLGTVYVQLSRPKLAVKGFEKALSLDPDYEEARIQLASLYLAEKSYDEAVHHLKILLKKNNRNPLIAEKLGILFYNQKKFDDAAQYFLKALEISPTRAVAVHNYLGMTYYSLGQKENARNSLMQAQEAQVITTEGRRLMALLYMDEEKYAEAIRIYSELLQEIEGSENDYNNLGTAYSRVDEYELAVQAYSKVLEFNDQNEVALYNLSLALLKLENYEKAANINKQLSEIKPDDPQVFYYKGYIAERLMQYPEAIAAYEQALALGYTDAATLQNMITYLKSRQEQRPGP